MPRWSAGKRRGLVAGAFVSARIRCPGQYAEMCSGCHLPELDADVGLLVSPAPGKRAQPRALQVNNSRLPLDCEPKSKAASVGDLAAVNPST
jgi:hypothetical protein